MRWGCLTCTVLPPSLTLLPSVSVALQRAHRRFYERKKQRVSAMVWLVRTLPGLEMERI
jgi:hypothetical protein